MSGSGPSPITEPVLAPKKPQDVVRMTARLRKFEDHLVQELMELPEGPERTAKEKRLGIARGVRAGLEWSLGIAGKEIDQNLIGAEWESFVREQES